MIFASPALLWALPAALIPVLLHLLSRRRAARVPFGDLTLLRRIHARALPKTRLRQWLLVAARCLILLCLIAAYARPVLRASAAPDKPGAGAGEGLDLVILVDRSYSMGFRQQGKTRLELARRQAEDIVRGLKASDRVAIASFSDEVEGGPLQWQSQADALAALARAEPGSRTTDYAAALRSAAGLLAAEPRRRRVILLLSDGARHGMRGALPSIDPAITLLCLGWTSAANASVVSAAPAAGSGALRPRLSVRVAGAGRGSVDVWVDGRRAQSVALKPVAASEQTVSVDLPPARNPADPSWSGWVALKPDALTADDSYFFSFRHPARPRLLVLFGNPGFFKMPGAGYFLKELLGGAQESLLDYDADFLELGRLGEARLSDYRIVVISDFKDVPAPAAAGLESFVRRGGGLWVLPGARTSADGFDRLNEWLPARFGTLVAGEGAGLKAVAVKEAKLWREFDLARVAVSRYYLLTLKPGAAVEFKSAGGYPLAASGAHGAGRAAVWASSLDTAWSNLALKPVFAAWVQTALDELAGGGARQSESFDSPVGQPLIHEWRPDEAAPASVRFAAPDGRATTVWLKGRRIEYGGAAAPGLYAMTEEGSGKRTVFAVNLDRRSGESELAPLADAPWRTLSGESAAADFRLEVYGQDGRGPVLAAAAGFALAEMFLALPRAGNLLLVLLALAFLGGPAAAQQGDRFVWSQVKLGPEWDPFPAVPGDVVEFLSTLTSVLSEPTRRVLTLKDKALWSSPLIVLAGRQAPPPLDDEERRNLRDYLLAGGMLWIEDVSGAPSSSFDRWVRQTLPQVLPESELTPLPADHVVYKTFFLLRGPAGRTMARDALEGVSWSGRSAVIYSRNDILGAWAKDALGKPLYPCVPGGETQRTKAKRLTLNIIMYALTGSYKADAVHQPYLLQKMRSGIP